MEPPFSEWLVLLKSRVWFQLLIYLDLRSKLKNFANFIIREDYAIFRVKYCYLQYFTVFYCILLYFTVFYCNLRVNYTFSLPKNRVKNDVFEFSGIQLKK
jgi:hypothetical protein